MEFTCSKIDNVNNRILVKSTRSAKKMILAGFTVIDIKPYKTDNKRTVFIFKASDELIKFIIENNIEV